MPKDEKVMDENDVFVICAMDSIERGDARAFSLSRIDEEGETKPFSIVILRTERDAYFGYVNACPHNGIWLNVGDGKFFSEDRVFLECGRHHAKFDVETGVCVDGPCEGQCLDPLAIAIIDGDVCLCGIELVEDDGYPDPFDDFDDTMEIMIHPD